MLHLIRFEENFKGRISNNYADYVGGALYISNNSSVTFKETSNATISNNHRGGSRIC